jgi:hypothetical protein
VNATLPLKPNSANGSNHDRKARSRGKAVTTAEPAESTPEDPVEPAPEEPVEPTPVVAAPEEPEPGIGTEFLRTVGLAPAPKAEAVHDPRGDQLRRRRATLRERRYRQETRTSVFMVLAAACILLGPFLGILEITSWTFVGYVELYGVAFLGGALITSSSARKLTRDVIEVNNEIDLDDIAKGKVGPDEQAARLHQVSQVDLKRYYDQTLRQGAQIFYVGVSCILLGFIVIGVAFWLVQNDTTQLSEKIVVSSLGAIGGILANFIAVIYLRMFSRTVKSVSDFHARLVTSDRTNFGNILAAKIGKDTLREQTLASMAVQLVSDGTGEAHHNGAKPSKQASNHKRTSSTV